MVLRVLWALLKTKKWNIDFVETSLYECKNFAKDPMKMCEYNSKEFNKHMCLNRYNGLQQSPFNNALNGTDILELRLEGP